MGVIGGVGAEALRDDGAAQALIAIVKHHVLSGSDGPLRFGKPHDPLRRRR